MPSYESIQLDGLELNDGATYVLEELNLDPPRKRVEWATGADADGAGLVRDPLLENRTITMRVRVLTAATMDAALSAVGTVVDRLEEMERREGGAPITYTPADSTKTITFYGLTGSVIGVPRSWSGDEAGWFVKRPVFTVEITARPFGYGTEVVGTAVTASLPAMTLTVGSVPGDVPAEGRLIVTAGSSQHRRHLEWGLEQRYYDAATSLLIDSASLVVTGTGGTAGATAVAGYGSNTISMTARSSAQTIAKTGTLAHVGTFRVKAQVHGGGTDDAANARWRLAWRDGDGPYRSNPWVAPTGSGWSEVDLGTVTVNQAITGAQRWEGRIEVYSTSGTPTVYLDFLVLVPVAEGYGKAMAGVAQPVGFLSALDQFTGTTAGGTLSARTPVVGAAWTTEGTTATDFTFADAAGGEVVTLGGTSHTRRGALGSSITDQEVSARIQTQVVSAVNRNDVGVVARYVDASNHVLGHLRFESSQVWLRLGIVVAGAASGVSKDVTSLVSAQTWFRLRVVVWATGAYNVSLLSDGGAVLATVSNTRTDLATAGALASGRGGLYGQNASINITPYWDEITVNSIDPEPVVIYSARTAEVRSDRTIRQNSDGTAVGDVPAYRGSRFYVPPAGQANRTSRVLVKASRTDVESGASVAQTTPDSLTAQVAYTPRYAVIPR